jgi:cyclohexa-1,5-dienecarbonyl-CoA hydratase
MDQYKHIAYEEKNKTGFLTLQREDEINVLNIEMMNEINSVLESLNEGPHLKALVIRAKGRAFSAGVDVSEHTEQLVDQMIETFHRIFHLLDRLECPTVAIVNGAALGGGCELACFCDMVIAREGAKFGQPEIKVGVFPPVAAAAFPQYSHLKKIYELLLVGDTILAEEAERIGLVNQVYPKEEFEKKAEEFVYRLTSNSGAILRYTKKAVKHSMGKSSAEALSISEKIYLDEMMKTRDAHEGLAAFMEKRKPEWRDE